MANWIVQANPKQFDIDTALTKLDTICWRVPQYTDEIRPGDQALIWRSGPESGIVGLGTFTESPRLAEVPAAERPFVTDDAKEGNPETRATLAVRAHPLVPKATVAATPGLAEHQIVRAPMGTVFKVSPGEWAQFESLLAATPPLVDLATDAPSDVPPPYAWSERRKDTYPMPGGYDEYLVSLRSILELAMNQRFSTDELAKAIQTRFGLSATNARLGTLFLRRAGLLYETNGIIELSDISKRYYLTGDPRLVVAQLHSRIQLIGELLDLLDSPQSSDELLDLVNARYGMGWTTKAQIQRRRGWLQSAGVLTVDDERRYVRTELGTELLKALSIHPPADAPATVDELPDTSDQGVGPETETELTASTTAETQRRIELTCEDLAQRLTATSRDSTHPDDFEHALREAFEFLGFRAEKLGGAGKTDVLVDADLGRDHSYRIIIDGKTTAKGTIPDHQIDWETINDHRRQYEADYVVIAGPDFAGDRVYERAERNGALLMTVNDVIGLLEQHADSPVSLLELRPVFESDTAEMTLDAIADSVETRERLIEIAKAVMAAAEKNVPKFGGVTARDLHIMLTDDEELEPQEDEIAEALAALSSPLIGAFVEIDGSYLPGEPRRTLERRLSWLQRKLT